VATVVRDVFYFQFPHVMDSHGFLLRFCHHRSAHAGSPVGGSFLFSMVQNAVLEVLARLRMRAPLLSINLPVLQEGISKMYFIPIFFSTVSLLFLSHFFCIRYDANGSCVHHQGSSQISTIFV
jgi:hypothetical protein